MGVPAAAELLGLLDQSLQQPGSKYLRFKTFKNYVYAEVYVGGMCCTFTHTHAHESDIAHAHTEVR